MSGITNLGVWLASSIVLVAVILGVRHYFNGAIFRKKILDSQMQNAAPGKVVVRELNTGLYLNETGFLTREMEDGKEFDSATVALVEARRGRLQAAEIVLI